MSAGLAPAAVPWLPLLPGQKWRQPVPSQLDLEAHPLHSRRLVGAVMQSAAQNVDVRPPTLPVLPLLTSQTGHCQASRSQWCCVLGCWGWTLQPAARPLAEQRRWLHGQLSLGPGCSSCGMGHCNGLYQSAQLTVSQLSCAHPAAQQFRLMCSTAPLPPRQAMHMHLLWPSHLQRGIMHPICAHHCSDSSDSSPAI